MESGKLVVEFAGKSFEHTVAAEEEIVPDGSVQTVSLGKVTLNKPGLHKVAVKAVEIDPKAIEYDQGLCRFGK